MNVRELIKTLSDYDPEMEVVVEYDTHFNDIRSVQPQMILLESSSWGDYAGERATDQRGRPITSPTELGQDTVTPHKTVLAIWGTHP
ncbi:Uncharacterized protein ALO70_03716 [Pseudomonas amygdali pv. eriobotryae]|uniref:Uncharacterized protein n=1 Tax=Pseudomonas amygdali pv. eriobotryae TaxID=129137 RepID=A0A0P9R0M4_PSEA0|nr:hypothetical protein [Pseudomonas amygdali]KPX21501.1 Uncharacterized protein ALO70_03716 [Pseudomonas amygdali pv. eriobotryae]KWS75525.1 hypothetical protein AL052_08790 [Pseudomonas amygdali pv. eriobotryae]RMM01095.1 hypothetical protein ALQ86_01365 [Pseudomonas amygdali pv. eriobotryae]RMO64428.1 hypothetical protein ALQ39_04087 [Pseudomonas amygdali pv. eriobotryae]GFZ73622.1 hypothetical protein PSE10C_43640 [Pseudomonas amygdali pv. eriobotryae]